MSMSGRQSKMQNLIEGSSFNKMEPYFSKKSSVIALLSKLLYVIVTCIFGGYGVYFLIESTRDELFQDRINFEKKSNEWNVSAYRDNLKSWDIYITNEKNLSLYLYNEEEKMHKYEDNNQLYYNPLQKVNKNIAPLISNIKLNKKKSDTSSYSYNLTANFSLEITNSSKISKKINLDNIDIFINLLTPGVKQNECVKNKGLWNYEDESCYKYYMLRTLCIILDQNKQELFVDYKNFKCNGFLDWYESFSVFPWMVPSYDPNFDDLQASNKKITLYLSTNKDPYVWTSYNGTFHFSNVAQSYSTAGIFMIACSLALAAIPIMVYYRQNTKDDITNEINEKVEGEDEIYQLKVINNANDKDKEKDMSNVNLN